MDKGVVALDIDGTITSSAYDLDARVKKCLQNVVDKGWALIFLTGRTLTFARPLLSQIERPFLVAVQNGAALIHFPEERLLWKRTLETKSLSKLEPLFKKLGLGLIIERGFEEESFYFLEATFTKEEREYLAFRQSLSNEKWVAISSVTSLPFSEFAVVKVFASKEKTDRINQSLAGEEFSITTINDPFRPGYHLTHITAKEATKEKALQHVLSSKPKKTPLIVAGDDANDLHMLKLGDIKIVMEHSPKELCSLGDIVTDDIASALEKAMKRAS